MKMTSLRATSGLACAMVLAGVTASFAQEEPKVDCGNPVTQFDMNHCAHVDYEVADKALNTTYKAVMTRMVDIDKDLAESMPNLAGAADALKTAQRAWIGYRDGHCELSGFSARGGSMEPMLVSGCLAELTNKRTAELKELLDAY